MIDCYCNICGATGQTSESILKSYPMSCGHCGKQGWVPKEGK